MAGSTPSRFWILALALALPLFACSDEVTPPASLDDPGPVVTAPQVAVLSCTGNVAEASVLCGPASPVRPDGVLFDQRIVGGQGLFVALASANVAYAGGVFAFDVTIRNLMSLGMATADGNTRHPEGVRIFFHEGPVATSGAGSITIINPTGSATFTSTSQPFFQYGGAISGADQADLGLDGVLASGEISTAKNWRLEMPATVETFTFTLLVAAEMPDGPVETVAPQVTSITPDTLVPGAVATITGVNFNPTPGNNTVTIRGVPATVTSATSTELQVTVPCVSSGAVPVSITRAGLTGATVSHPLSVAQHTVPVGGLLLLDATTGTACNELTSADGAARYVVSVFSNSTSPASNSPFRISADGPGDPGEEVEGPGEVLASPAVPTGLVTPEISLADAIDDANRGRAEQEHLRIHEMNREFLEQHGALLRGPSLAPTARDMVSRDTSPNRTFRIPNIAGSNFCTNYYVVDATRVYFDGRIAIYEDDAMPEAFKAANSAIMASNYQRIGDQFNEDMDPIVTTYFGDVLRRDAELDDNGVLLVLVTPRINTSFSGVAGFVTTCDQFPNDDLNSPPAGGPYAASVGSIAGASNRGEIFYSYAPTVDVLGYNSGNTPENWYRTIRSTFIHETKHVASYVARIANGAPVYEASWLEESTARHVEELWGRIAVDNIAWKSNTGYGSAGNPVNYYCDARPISFAECDANPRRPANIMQRHFTSLYTHMFGQNARLLSPFGATASDNASYFYAVGWSLVRYAADRYAMDEAAFFQALNQSVTNGADNLTAVTGATVDELLAGWSLALAVDDHPLWAQAPGPELSFQTWNFRSVYGGMNADFPGNYTLAYPNVPTARAFGSFAPVFQTTVRGGGVLWYELSGTQTAAQLLRLEASAGGPPPSTLRMAVTRIQ